MSEAVNTCEALNTVAHCSIMIQKRPEIKKPAGFDFGITLNGVFLYLIM